MSRWDTKNRTPKLPKQSRQIPLPASSERGNGLDAGRYFRCWNCGFVCDIDRDSLGGARSGSGVNPQEYYPQPDTGVEVGQCVLGGLDSVFVALEQGADGLAKGIQHSLWAVVSGGCPLCGSKNWKGEF